MAIADVMIYESGDGGEFQLVNNDIQAISGLTNQIYLALFGGNIDVDGDWWGNEYFETENQFISLFESTISKVALTASGLKKLIETAKKDLKFLTSYGELNVDANIINRNYVELLINLIQTNNQDLKVKFVWDYTKNEVIENIII